MSSAPTNAPHAALRNFTRVWGRNLYSATSSSHMVTKGSACCPTVIRTASTPPITGTCMSVVAT